MRKAKSKWLLFFLPVFVLLVTLLLACYLSRGVSSEPFRYQVY